MDGGLGLPISRNGMSSQPQSRIFNWTSSSNGPPKLPGGPTVIEEPFKKLKKPLPQSQAQSRSSTPTPSNNGVNRMEGDKKPGGEGRGMAASTSIKSLSDSSSADTTDSKVIFRKYYPNRPKRAKEKMARCLTAAFVSRPGLRRHQERTSRRDSLHPEERVQWLAFSRQERGALSEHRGAEDGQNKTTGSQQHHSWSHQRHVTATCQETGPVSQKGDLHSQQQQQQHYFLSHRKLMKPCFLFPHSILLS